MSKRGLVLVGFAVPVLFLIGLLAWASIKTGGNPGGLGVNSEFGQVEIDQEVAHDFSLELLDGGSTELSQFQGKILMLDFWASWCLPCQQEAPVLADVYREYEGQGVEFLGIDIWDGRQNALDHLEQFGVPYANGIDSSGVIAIDYGVKGIPEKIFIDENGVITKKFVGPISSDSLRAELEALLGSKGASP